MMNLETIGEEIAFAAVGIVTGVMFFSRMQTQMGLKIS